MSKMKYKVKRQLRQMPGNVTVFEADQRDLNRKVEVRVLNQFVGPDSDTYLRFEREFKTIARLDHPNVVKVYDWGLAEDKIYYVAERRPASPMADFVAKNLDLGHAEILTIGGQIADALSYLHEQSLVHRDIGLESIYYAPEKKIAYVAHFNMVKNLNLEDLTAKGVAQVAPLAFTPERLQQKDIDHRTDVFLLAAMIYRLLVGKDPLPREQVLMNPGAQFSIQLPSEGNPDLDPCIDEVLMKALQFDPGARYQTAAAMKDAFDEARDKVASRAGRPRKKPAPAGKPHMSAAIAAPQGDEMLSAEIQTGAAPPAPTPAAGEGPGEAQLRSLGLGALVDQYGAVAVWGMLGSGLLVALLLLWILL